MLEQLQSDFQAQSFDLLFQQKVKALLLLLLRLLRLFSGINVVNT